MKKQTKFAKNFVKAQMKSKLKSLINEKSQLNYFKPPFCFLVFMFYRTNPVLFAIFIKFSAYLKQIAFHLFDKDKVLFV